MPRFRSKSMRKRDPHVLGFDSEDDGKGNPFLFTAVHESGRFHATTRTEFLEKLFALSCKVRADGRYVEAWATNLEYDLVNVFGLERIHEVRLRFGRTYLVAATWKGITFRDTFRHLPISVEMLGDLVGLKKLRRSKSLRYAMRDAQITYRGAKYLHDTYRTLGVRPRNTLAASALALWQEQFFPHELERPAAEILDAAREAYHGGRTEPFAIGEYKNVSVIDVASMFPWAMVSNPFPVPWKSYRHVGKGARVTRTGLYRVRVTVKSAPGPVPYRTDAGTIYPLGTWVAWYTGVECCYLLARGDAVTVLEGFEFLETVDPFREYIAKLFELKNASRGSERDLYKLLLNALYGKFGERSGRIVFETLARYEKRTNPPMARIWNGLAIYRVEQGTRPYANVLWSAMITARARLRLHAELERIIDSDGTVLYCDTDSVFYTGSKLRYPKRADQPGMFELKGKYHRVQIVGKKEYALQTSTRARWIPFAKGVPKDARFEYLQSGHAAFIRPTRLLEATRRGMRPNVWEHRTKQRHVDYRKRRRNPDGTLAPLTVG